MSLKVYGRVNVENGNVFNSKTKHYIVLISFEIYKCIEIKFATNISEPDFDHYDLGEQRLRETTFWRPTSKT